jgi:hypothetical protein
MNRSDRIHSLLIALSLLAAACGPHHRDIALEAGPDELISNIAAQSGRANHGYKLNEKGFIDTDLRMSDFFGAAFTISAWFMPEYTSCYYGPIFGESGGGYFVVGLGDYRRGDGGFLDGGSPVLYMKVGNKEAFYLAPGLTKRAWNHLAVVRTTLSRGGSHTFHLYLNGQRLQPSSNANGAITPQPDISFSTADPMTQGPQGYLRFGRRTSGGQSESSRTWQFFGLIDEVAVMGAARTAAEIAQMATTPRVLGSESNLLAGWTFDEYLPLNWMALAPALKRPVTRSGPAHRVSLSWPRNGTADATYFDNPFFVSPTQVNYRLPLPANQIWRVVQGYDSPTGSHNGYAAYSLDFARVGGPSGLPRVSASVTGDIVDVNETVDPDPNVAREPYTLSITGAPNEFANYLHLAYGSWTEVFLDGQSLPPPRSDDPATAMAVSQGEDVAALGPVADHLHYGVSSHLGVRGQFPAAFEAYYASDDKGVTWVPVFRGVPRVGQYVYRIQ